MCGVSWCGGGFGGGGSGGVFVCHFFGEAGSPLGAIPVYASCILFHPLTYSQVRFHNNFPAAPYQANRRSHSAVEIGNVERRPDIKI